MNRDKPVGQQAADEHNSKVSLRQKAEAQFRKREDLSQEKLDSLSPETLRASLHELRVHQIELEIQNEELRAAQADLDASRARYFDLYDMAPVGYCTVSEKGLILEANLTAATLLRRERDALVGRRLSAFISKEDHELYYRFRKKLLDTTQPQECDLRMVRKDGTVFFAQLSATAAQDEAGAPVCRVTLNDISERRRAENEILASEEKHRRLFETMAQGVVYQDSDGKIISANPAAQKILGLSLDEMNGKTSMDPDWMTVREDGSPLPGQEHPSMTALHTGKTVGPFVMGVKNPRASCTVWISVNATPLFQPNETKPFQVYTTFDDITARKNAEAKRTESDARFRSYFELPLHGTCITSPEKGWLEVNDRLCEILGYTRQEIFSKTWAEMTLPGDLAADVAQFDRILSGEIGQYQLEKRFICKDGTVIWTEISVGCVRKSDGTVDHFICLMEDITERKKAEESLLNLRAAVEQSANTIAITDIRGNIEYVNPAFEKTRATRRPRPLGKPTAFSNPVSRMRNFTAISGRPSRPEKSGRASFTTGARMARSIGSWRPSLRSRTTREKRSAIWRSRKTSLSRKPWKPVWPQPSSVPRLATVQRASSST